MKKIIAPCLIAGCSSPHHSAGLCKGHYETRRDRDPLAPRCSSTNCDRAAWYSGLCKGHLTRKRRGQSINTPLKWKRQPTRIAKGYKYIGSKSEHKIVMENLLGRPLIKGAETVHHKNGDRSDNRPENLELWSKSQPAGQRVEDKVKWAKEILSLYEGVL